MTIADVQINEAGLEIKLRSEIGDDLLAAAYLRLKSERLLAVVFHANPAISLQEFLTWHRDPGMDYLGCFSSIPGVAGSTELRGLGWINQIRTHGDEKVAEVGLAFFRGLAPNLCAEFTSMLLDYCFQSRNLAAVYGVSPVDNRVIHRFAGRMGFERFGPLPKFTSWQGRSTDAIIHCMTKSRWMGR